VAKGVTGRIQTFHGGRLECYVLNQLDTSTMQWDLLAVDALRSLVAPSLRLGCHIRASKAGRSLGLGV
jgi:hypothetical protein